MKELPCESEGDEGPFDEIMTVMKPGVTAIVKVNHLNPDGTFFALLHRVGPVHSVFKRFCNHVQKQSLTKPTMTDFKAALEFKKLVILHAGYWKRCEILQSHVNILDPITVHGGGIKSYNYTSVPCLLVDSGEITQCHQVYQIREQHENLRRVPPQAVKCSLAYAGAITIKTLAGFAKLTKDKVLKLEISPEGIFDPLTQAFRVNLYATDGPEGEEPLNIAFELEKEVAANAD